jgi:uncharacterized membrane protein
MAYEKSVSTGALSLRFFCCLSWGYVNIPVAQLPADRVLSNQEISFFGMRYVIPRAEEWHRTVIVINLVGAVIQLCSLFTYY